MHGVREAKQKILGAKTIVISGHINPDGDSIGSLLAMGLGLEKLGKTIYMISCDGAPKKYRFLPGARRIVKTTDIACDLAIAVDCSNKEILGDNLKAFKNAKAILSIDHHAFRRPFEDISLIDHKAAAVGEIIYILLKELGADISKDIAQNLLTSIIVETNSFRLPSIRTLTFQLCAELLDKKVDFYKLVDKVYWSETKEAAVLSGICLARCKFLKNNKIAWSIVRKSDFQKAKGSDEDVDAVAERIRSIRGVKIVVLFREKDEKMLRVSLRSKGRFNIASVAEKFGGGGHFDIAGCQIPYTKEMMQKVLNSARGLLE